ncbi:nuclear transport factor 2 family protein [Sphingomonas sp. BT553]|uniref:Nuclear transport factor 2 family protein n=2 Tax=Sphingomonas mollis TaxID=2795726 RepID=A0ABS0XLA2_9SPHN|nr:nuclear transport factor 2 family protein [Sphingomonas sp. BT553]
MLGPIALGVAVLGAGQPVVAQTAARTSGAERTLIELSRQKWRWMAERNVDALAKLFDDQAIFVHMSRTMTKPQELEVISSRNIEYRQADIKDISVRFVGDTAIVASRIDLHAIVRGEVADNPFSVTETYVKQRGDWKLGALVFSKRSVPN